MTSPSSAARAARNESVFRELNEQLGAATAGSLSDVRGFVCECADISCTTVLGVPLGEYERVRRNPAWFIVAPAAGHVVPTVEQVVERHPEYWVVEKLGESGDIAEELDPNS